MTRTGPRVESLRVGIVGAGYIAEPHILAVQRLPNATLVALCDLSEARAQSLAAAFGVAKYYRSAAEMIAQERLDAVHILVPPELHEKVAREVLELGVHVLTEKPIAESVSSAERMLRLAHQHGKTLGVSHNFLFSEPYQKLRNAMRAQEFGHVDQIDVVWNKELGQIKAGPHGGWLFQEPGNPILEVGPHSLAHVLDLVGELDEVQAFAKDPVAIPGGRVCYRLWEVIGFRGATSVRLRFALGGGHTEHYIVVRGRSGSARVDFEKNTYVVHGQTAHMLDIDRFLTTTAAAGQELVQANETFANYMLGKLGARQGGKPFFDAIAGAVAAFYRGIAEGTLDERLSAALGVETLRLAERILGSAHYENFVAPSRTPSLTPTLAGVGTSTANGTQNGTQSGSKSPARARRGRASVPPSGEKVVVFGGSGFIGRALIRRLVQENRIVRVIARNPLAPIAEFSLPGVDVLRGDFTDTEALREHLRGAEAVYHLARGHGSKWGEYLHYDVEPTLRLAELSDALGVRSFYYTSSIAIYWAGARAGTILETTPAHPGVARANLYARSKVEIEKRLTAFAKRAKTNVVIFRPGVVIGSGGPPMHWGLGAWPHPSVCRIWGDGRAAKPFVLVDDCADAMVRALAHPSLRETSFNLVGDVAMNTLEYLDELERVAGLKIKRVAVDPKTLFAEEVAKFLIKRAGGSDMAMPSFACVDGYTLAAPFDCSRSKNQLDWKPVSDREAFIEAGIRVPARETFA